MTRELGHFGWSRLFGALALALGGFVSAPAAYAQTTSLIMTSEPGDWVGSGQSYNFTPAAGTFDVYANPASAWAGQQVRLFFHTPDYSHFFGVHLSAPIGQSLVPGVYSNATRFSTAAAGGIDVFGDGHGCNATSGTFVVLDAEFGPNLEVLAFRAKFEQYCDGAAAAIRGEFRYNAVVPFELTSPMGTAVTAGQPVSFIVAATGSLTPVVLSATNLPPGATFLDNGNSTGTFSWTNTLSYPGEYLVWFEGEDGDGEREIGLTSIRIAPVNDNLSAATGLGSTAGTTASGTTAGASVEPGETSFYRTVWFKFTSGASERTVVETDGATLDTVLTVYYDPTPATPASFNELGFVEQNDNDGDGPHSRVVFDAVGGRTYYVAVRGADQATGAFQLRWRRAEMARLLWERADGAIALWTVDSRGSLTANPTFGPYAGWKAVKIAVGSDGMTRVLWKHQTGMVTVWTVDRSGAIVSHPAYGPFAGWTVSDLALERDGRLHLGWIHDNGTYGFWLMSPDAATLQSSVFYGPYAGWLPQTFSVTDDGQRRILWRSAANAVGLWAEPPPYGIPSSFDLHGPFPGWTAADIGSGEDASSARVLWEHTDGAMALWRQLPGGYYMFESAFGPFTGWRPFALAMANVAPDWGDSSPRVLWRHSGGGIALWRVSFDHEWAYTFAYGPFAGWTVTDIAVGPE